LSVVFPFSFILFYQESHERQPSLHLPLPTPFLIDKFPLPCNN
jgi:hypothetical protein